MKAAYLEPNNEWKENIRLVKEDFQDLSILVVWLRKSAYVAWKVEAGA